MERIINAEDERALVMEYAVRMDGVLWGVPVDTARELLGHEAVEILTCGSFRGLYWNIHTDPRGSVKYLTLLGFVRAIMNYNLMHKCEIIPFRQRAASSGADLPGKPKKARRHGSGRAVAYSGSARQAAAAREW